MTDPNCLCFASKILFSLLMGVPQGRDGFWLPLMPKPILQNCPMRALFVVGIVAFFLLLQSCLTCERKDYSYQILSNEKAILTIRYINIFAAGVDSSAVLANDYDELMAVWYMGHKIEADYPGSKLISKRLYEQEGVLCGEVKLEINDLKSCGIIQYNGKGPRVLGVSTLTDDNEVFLQSNGEYGGDKTPVVFWPEKADLLQFSTRVTMPDSTGRSLLGRWREKGAFMVSVPM